MLERTAAFPKAIEREQAVDVSTQLQPRLRPVRVSAHERFYQPPPVPEPVASEVRAGSAPFDSASGHAVVGKHGAERRAGQRADARWVDALAPLRVRLVAMRDEFSQVGVRVEDKLQSIALHDRAAPDADAAREAISRALLAALQGLRRFEGKRVVNVVAAQAPDKTHAARASLAEVHNDRLFFVGDDLNDEPVFESALPDWVTVKVGSERPSGARFSLEDQAQIGMAVDCILQTMSAQRGL